METDSNDANRRDSARGLEAPGECHCQRACTCALANPHLRFDLCGEGDAFYVFIWVFKRYNYAFDK